MTTLTLEQLKALGPDPKSTDPEIVLRRSRARGLEASNSMLVAPERHVPADIVLEVETPETDKALA